MKMKSFTCAVLTVLVLLAACRVHALTLEDKAENKTLSPYFVIEKGNPSTDRFPLKETNVSVAINGVIADVRVVQKYSNDGRGAINARYVFPASTRASVHGMKMTVGNQVVTAKIKEREEAKATFEKAKSEGKSASLLEQQRPNVFTMSVANIMPRDEVVIELHYTELLVPSEGTYEFVYPTVVGPRYSNQPEASAPETDKWVKSPYLKEGRTPPTRFSINVSLSTGIPLQEVASPSHEITVSRKDKAVAGVSLSKPGEFGGNRDFILRYKLAGQEIQSGLMLYEGDRENFFLLMVQPPERVKLAEIPPREYIFILDVSGSMHGFPLDTAKELIRNLIGGLRPTDTFNLITFSGASDIMAPYSVSATKENILRAVNLVDSQTGGGGTELSPALRRALSLPRTKNTSRTVVIITDGFIAAEKEAFALINQNINTTNVFTFGIGSGVNRYFIEGLARAGLGEPFVVTRPDEAHGAAERFRAYVQSPLLTNVNVRFKGFEAYDVEPPALPDLFARRPLVIFGKWRGKASGEIEISGKTVRGSYDRTFRVADTKPLPENSALAYLWARTKVARLADYNLTGEASDTKKAVTDLGLTYSLLTPYTSFVAVVEQVRNPRGSTDDVDQPLPLPLGVSNLAVGGCSAVPEPEIVLLVGIMIMVALFICLRRFSSRRRG